MIYILYSNDYEVFLGGNYLPESEILIDTTNSLLDACDELDVPMTLFCDLICLWRYREMGYPEFPDAVERQLVQAVKNGHDVQTHVHPHWLETEISFGANGSTTYQVDPAKFLLGNWSPNDGRNLFDFCLGIFQKAKQHLENLLIPINPNYECMAYRAGGYGIQPHSKEIFSALKNSKYTIDSSIVPGMTYQTDVNRIDFTQIPELGNYSISPDRGIYEAADDGVFEIPVLALRKGEARWPLARAFFRKVLKSIVLHKKYQPLGYPIQMTQTPTKKNTLLKQLMKEVSTVLEGWYMLELGDDENLMFDVATAYIDKYHVGSSDLFVSISCHSKSMNSRRLDAFKTFHKRLASHYGSQMKTITFQEAGNVLNRKRNKQI